MEKTNRREPEKVEKVEQRDWKYISKKMLSHEFQYDSIYSMRRNRSGRAVIPVFYHHRI